MENNFIIFYLFIYHLVRHLSRKNFKAGNRRRHSLPGRCPARSGRKRYRRRRRLSSKGVPSLNPPLWCRRLRIRRRWRRHWITDGRANSRRLLKIDCRHLKPQRRRRNRCPVSSFESRRIATPISKINWPISIKWKAERIRRRRPSKTSQNIRIFSQSGPISKPNWPPSAKWNPNPHSPLRPPSSLAKPLNQRQRHWNQFSNNRKQLRNRSSRRRNPLHRPLRIFIRPKSKWRRWRPNRFTPILRPSLWLPHPPAVEETSEFTHCRRIPVEAVAEVMRTSREKLRIVPKKMKASAPYLLTALRLQRCLTEWWPSPPNQSFRLFRLIRPSFIRVRAATLFSQPIQSNYFYRLINSNQVKW